MKNLILVGGFSEIIEMCELLNYTIVGIIDPCTEKEIYGYKVLGSDKDAPSILNEYPDVPVVVTPDLPLIRKGLVKYYKNLGFKIASLISHKSNISRTAKLGEGVIVHDGVNVSANVHIADFVRLNVNSNIMHDCQIGKYTTIAPNAVLLGRVQINECAYIVANATILPDAIIYENAIVGAGAVVTKIVAKDQVVKGVPAK